MSELAQTQHATFHARIARINKAEKSTAFPTPGAHDAPDAGGYRNRPQKMQPKRQEKSFGLVIAFAIAAAAVLAANVVVFNHSTFSYGPVGFLDKVVPAIGPWGIVGMIMFVVMIGFGMRDKPHVVGIALGLPFMWFGEPYLALFGEELWVMFYSAEHVDNMLVQNGLRSARLAS